MNRGALLVFVKDPVPGAVKTRLAPWFSPQEAAALSRAMAEDALATHLKARDYDTAVFYTPEGALRRFRAWLGDGVTFVSQTGDDLGERELAALRWAFDKGYERAVIVGSDVPGVGAAEVRGALDALDEAAVVLGPAEDGGYWLIGATRAEPRLFGGIEWSSVRVLDATLARAAEAGLACRLLEPRFDVDTIADVERLRAYFECGNPDAAPRTRAVLAAHFDRRK